jgi:hypothetical protein
MCRDQNEGEDCKFGKNCDEFPDSTPLGYRGYMVPHERVLQMPDITVQEGGWFIDIRFVE